MSADKKRDRALQHRVRDRQAKTGESYQAAWRHVADSADSEASSPSVGTRRVPLPLGTGGHAKTGKRVKILPGQSAQITGRPQLETFWPDRLLIKNTDRWRVDELFVGAWKDWNEAEFAKRRSFIAGSRELPPEPEYIKHSLLEAGPRAASAFSLSTWQPLTTREVPCGREIILVVTYIGKNLRGEGFEATLFGWDGKPPTRSTKSSEVYERVTERAESARVAAHEMVILPLTVTSPLLFVDRLTIADAKDWIVNNIEVRNKSIFVQSGELPGELFLDSAPVILEPLAAKDRVEVAATYVGSNSSACLVVELSGTAQPPSEPRTLSCFLPMSTCGIPIEPTQSAQITGRPQGDFLPERLVIADSDEWSVHDIKVGTHSQLAASGDIPGQSFAIDLVEGHMTFDPVRKGQDFIIVTTRDDDCKKSAAFLGGARGRLI